MKKGWQTKKLSDLYQVGSSKRVLKSQWKTSGVPFYRGREVTRLAADGFVENELFISEEHFAELSKEYGVPKAGDIVITAIGTIGNSHVVRSSDGFYFKDASVLWMKRTSEVSSEFVNLWLKSPRFFDQLDRGNGATVDTLTIQKLQSVEISVPPLAEQQRIVGVLDEVFAWLVTARAHAAQNLRNARALFESHLQSVFTHRGKGWVEDKLGALATKIGSGATPRGGEEAYKTEGVSLIRSLNVHGMGFRYEKLAFLDDAQADGLSNVVVQKRDVLLNITGASVARCCLAPEDVLPARVNQHVSIIRPIADKLSPEFLHYLLISRPYKSLLLQTGEEGGSTRQAITKAQIQEFKVAHPNLAGQQEVVTQLDALAAETQRLTRLYEQKQAALAALKKSLLHQAFAGEL